MGVIHALEKEGALWLQQCKAFSQTLLNPMNYIIIIIILQS